MWSFRGRYSDLNKILICLQSDSVHITTRCSVVIHTHVGSRLNSLRKSSTSPSLTMASTVFVAPRLRLLLTLVCLRTSSTYVSGTFILHILNVPTIGRYKCEFESAAQCKSLWKWPRTQQLLRFVEQPRHIWIHARITARTFPLHHDVCIKRYSCI